MFTENLKTSRQSAMVLITILFTLGGALGFYLLYLELGFSIQISLLATTCIFASTDFVRFFMMYGGGDLLVFGFCPWFLLLIMMIRSWRILSLGLIIIPLILLGTYLKSSFLLVAFSAILFLALEKRSLVFMLLLVPAYFLTEWYIIGYGDTPFSTSFSDFPLHNYHPEKVYSFLFIAGAPLASLSPILFSISQRVDGTAQYLYLTAQAMAHLYLLCNFKAKRMPTILIISLYALSFPFFFYAAFQNLYISLDTRHLFLPALILLPGVLKWWLGKGRFFKTLGAILLVLHIIAGIRLTHTHLSHFKEQTVMLPDGSLVPSKHFEIAAQIIELDQRLDQKALFFFASEDRSLELLVKNSRVLSLTPTLAVGIPKLSYPFYAECHQNGARGTAPRFQGRASKLFIIASHAELSLTKNCLQDYNTFRPIYKSQSGMNIYEAT